MKTTSKRLSIVIGMYLILPLVLISSCQEKGSDIVNPTSEVTFTKFSEISTLLKMAVEPADDDQCVKYQYPITFFAQLSSSEPIVSISINSDEELFDFFDQLSSSDEIRIDLPMTLIGEDDVETQVSTLDELEEILEVIVDACSGDQSYEYCHPNNKKVYICHNGNTLCVSVNAINAHLEHGDTLGQCDD